MNWDLKRHGRALQRIVALLFALAELAERAAAMPFAPRALVLAILRHAEAVAWAFALGTPCVSTASGRDGGQPQHPALPGVPSGGHEGPADAARLAYSLRLLALLVAGWATEALSSAAVPPTVRRRTAMTQPGASGCWRGPPALPAPDTS